MSEKRCIVCGVGPREVPDREALSHRVLKVCRPCHGKRLMGDLREVIRVEAERRKEQQP